MAEAAIFVENWLGDDAERLLVSLGLWKIRRFLEMGGRLRTACDFDFRAIAVKRPAEFVFPSTAELETVIREQISRCA